MAYTPITSWQAVGSPDRTWLGAAVRLVIDDAASTASSYAVYAECTAYQYPGASENLGVLWYYDGNLINIPTLYHRTDWTNSTGPVGDVYRVSVGTFASGQTAASKQWRVAIDLTGGRVYSNYATASYTVPSVPADPSAIANTRVSDSQQTVTWTASGTFTRVRLQRLVDGSTVGGEWTFADSVSSYVDTGTALGHSYSYRARTETVPAAGETFTLVSDWAVSAATYNTPAAPTAISGARTGASTVRLTLTNTATTSTALEVQASADAGDWSSATTYTFSGAGLATADITGVTGVMYFRARNTRGALASAWSPVSDAVVLITAPNPPTLTAPASGSVIDYTQSASATLSWLHNPVDGSAQTAAEVDWSTDGGSTWTTIALTTASSTTLALSSVIGQTVTWRVRTKGAANDWSGWSSTRTFVAYPEPTITIALEDGNGNDVTNGSLSDMPLVYTITATDGHTSPASATVEVAGYTEAVDVATLAGSITPAEVQLENSTTYIFSATLQMGSGLQATATVTVTTAYADPQAATLAIADESGIEQLTVGLAPLEAGETAADSIALYRISGGTSVLIASGLSDGSTVTDRYAPLNTPYIYRVRTYSAGGAARSTDFVHEIQTNEWMLMSKGGTIARGVWNPEGSIAYARPSKTRVLYAGRTWPVSYDGTALSQTASTSWMLLTPSERDAFVATMAEGGRGVYKSCDGEVYMADWELRLTPKYTEPGLYGTAALTLTRVESGAL